MDEDMEIFRDTILEIERNTFNPYLKLSFKIATNYFNKSVDYVFEMLGEKN
ncbi:hypothetical protein CBOS2020_05600 [Clostridium botulinum]|nr:hypothetical protein CBOS2020_05600 [Clostridium botulinum]